jgi:tetratricopeptide (TPR) repeat protein
MAERRDGRAYQRYSFCRAARARRRRQIGAGARICLARAGPLSRRLVVRAETEQTVINDLIDLGGRLIPNLKEVADRDRAVYLALDAIAAAGGNKPWLIVYDNVEKPGAIARLTPKTSVHILITSRWPRWQGHAQELAVDVFPEDVAVDFLLAERPHETREAAGRLAAALGGLPLGLSHARAYCAETNLSFDDYARRLSELIQEAPEDAEYPASVSATFSLAIAKAAEACPEAEKLMEIAAFLAPDRIPLDIITADVMSEKQREKAVAALFKVSLIAHDKLDDGCAVISLHRLIQAVTRASLEGRASAIAGQAVLLIRAARPHGFSSQDYREWPSIERLLPHALASLETAPVEGSQAADTGGLCNSIGRYFYQRGSYREAERFYIRALEIRERLFGDDHSEVGATLGNLAWLYTDQCRYREAEHFGKRAYDIATKNCGENHPDTSRCLHMLARLYHDLGRYEEAETLIKRSLNIAEAALGPNHWATGWRLKHLADIYSRQGRYADAELCYRRAIEIVGIEKDVTSGKILNNLATVYRIQCRNDEAERLYKLALEAAERAFGGGHPSTGAYLNNLASLYRVQGRHDEAESIHKRALGIAEAALGPSHPSTAACLNGLAILYDVQSRYEEGVVLHQRAIEIAELVLGKGHPTTGQYLSSLGKLYRTQRRYEEAERISKRALEIAEASLPRDHPFIGNRLCELGRLCRCLGRYQEAAPLFARAVAILVGSLGPNHPSSQEATTEYEQLNQEIATLGLSNVQIRPGTP